MYKVKGIGDDITIKTYKMMQTYFDYAQVRKILRGEDWMSKPADVTDIFESEDCTADSEPLLTVIENAADLFQCDDVAEIFPVDEAEENASSAELRRVDPDALETFLQAIWNDADTVTEPVCEIWAEENVKFTKEQAYELLLFCSLYSFLRREPENRDIELLKAYIDESAPKTAQYFPDKKKDISVFTNIAELPSFQGVTDGQSAKLSLIVIRNMLNTPVTVTLKNSPIQRHLAAHEELLALTANDKIVTFLPRFCAAQNYVYRQKENCLIATDKAGHTFSRPLDVEGPAFFSASKDYGILAADKDGRFLSAPFQGKRPDGAVCWLRGDLQDYGFLTPQGTYEGVYKRESWKDLLFFDLGIGSGIAVTADRRAIDSSGNTVGENVAAVNCCGNRFILLHMDGSVTTDRGELQIPDLYARAVCADQNGYWVAADDTLFHIDETVTKHEPVPDELERDNVNAMVYGLYADGEIRPLC